jgi:transposase
MTKIKHRMGKVKPEQWEKFLTSISEGMDKESAAAAAGFSRQAFYNRLNKAREEREKSENDAFENPNLDNFDMRFDKAAVTFETTLLNNINQIAQGKGKGNWVAAAWILERRYPEKYGRNRTNDNTPNEGRLTAAEMQEFLNTFSVRNSPIANKERIYDTTVETMKLLGYDSNDLPILDARQVKEGNDEFL